LIKQKIINIDYNWLLGPRMYTLLGCGWLADVKTEKGEGAVHLIVPEKVNGIRIK